MNKIIALIIVAFVGWIIFVKNDVVSYGPGVSAAEIPFQQNISASQKITLNNYQLTPLAEFAIKAKVLSKEDYSFGREADLSPTDLALGWGRMSDEAVISQLEITQGGRWYRWHTKSNGYPIPRNEIQTSSANMHIIAKNDAVSANLKRVKQGEIVNLKGQLVRVDHADGWHWVSSLTRNDTGAGACELFLVEDFQIEYH